jgi:hypothetical protein
MRTPANPLDPKSYKAAAGLFRALGKRACPLLGRDRRGRYEVIGTAVPLRGPKYAALLTASHVLDHLDDGNIVIAGSRSLLRFPAKVVKFSHSRPRPTVDVDIAAIALPAFAAAELDAFYEFTGAEELGDFDDYSKLTLYGLVGCPYTKNRESSRSSGERTVQPYFYVTREYAKLPEEGVKRPAVHVALRAPLRKMSGAQGRIESAPDPHGISGSGVWKIKLDPNGPYSSRPQLVGVGIEHHARQGLFVATRVGAGSIAVTELWKKIEEGKLETASVLELREDDA